MVSILFPFFCAATLSDTNGQASKRIVMQRFSETSPKLGITMLATCNTLHPAKLALEVESRGFDSLWLPEHSHIPTSRATAFPGAAPGREELPDVYWHLND